METNLETKRCVFCAESIFKNALFCRHCRQWQPKAGICACDACGEPILSTAHICKNCGSEQPNPEFRAPAWVASLEEEIPAAEMDVDSQESASSSTVAATMNPAPATASASALASVPATATTQDPPAQEPSAGTPSPDPLPELFKKGLMPGMPPLPGLPNLPGLPGMPGMPPLPQLAPGGQLMPAPPLMPLGNLSPTPTNPTPTPPTSTVATPAPTIEPIAAKTTPAPNTATSSTEPLPSKKVSTTMEFQSPDLDDDLPDENTIMAKAPKNSANAGVDALLGSLGQDLLAKQLDAAIGANNAKLPTASLAPLPPTQSPTTPPPASTTQEPQQADATPTAAEVNEKAQETTSIAEATTGSLETLGNVDVPQEPQSPTETSPQPNNEVAAQQEDVDSQQEDTKESNDETTSSEETSSSEQNDEIGAKQEELASAENQVEEDPAPSTQAEPSHAEAQAAEKEAKTTAEVASVKTQIAMREKATESKAELPNTPPMVAGPTASYAVDDATIQLELNAEALNPLLREPPSGISDIDPMFEEIVQSLEDDEYKMVEVLSTIRRLFWTPLRETIQKTSTENVIACLNSLDLSPVRLAIRETAHQVLDAISKIYQEQLNELAEELEMTAEEKTLYQLTDERVERLLGDVRTPFREFVERLEQLDQALENITKQLTKDRPVSMFLQRPLFSLDVQGHIEGWEEAKGTETTWELLSQATKMGLIDFKESAESTVEELHHALQQFISQFEPTYSAILVRVLEIWGDRLMPPLKAISSG